MTPLARLIAGVAALGLAAATLWLGVGPDAAPPVDAPAGGVAEAPASDLRLLILALSWQPSYCEESARERDRRVCARGDGFVVHGLWPEFAGEDRDTCPTDNPRLPESLARELDGIVPSVGLAGHQWRKHGTCTGLSQQAYVRLIKAAWGRVTIPPAFRDAAAARRLSPEAVEQEFLAVNPGLRPEMVDITCSDERLREVRICLTPDLAFTACDRRGNACRRGQIAVPAPQG